MTAENNLVVIRCLNGQVLKGYTQDFFPNRPSFHLLPAGGKPPVEVHCHELKAVFFVKDLTGNKARPDIKGFLARPGETAHGKKVAVRFKDGEILCGYSLSYVPGRAGFFMFPADSGSNNLRVYVVATSTAEVAAGPAADRLAQRAIEESNRRAA